MLPEGRGKVNARGLAHYDRLVDTLLAHGIAPCVTLFHWDLPAALDDRGGWLNPDIADWFTEYASAVFRKLDDRVPMWATLNEPWVVTDGGYLHGVLAPGHRNLFEAPVLFFAVCGALAITDTVTPLQLGLAWAYVGLRTVHSIIHVTYNRVIHRFLAYVASLVILFLMWALFGVALWNIA